MARRPRLDYEGALHHVFDRGTGKQTIFFDDEDRSFFVRRLRKLSEELDLRVLALCLMENHFHIVVHRGKIPLHRAMQRLLTAHSRVFNDRWTKVGHVFQGRYGSRLIIGENDLRVAIRYVHRNPVEAQLAKSPAEWSWSGHHDVMRGTYVLSDGVFVQKLFGGTAEYLEFVENAALAEGQPRLEEIAGTEIAVIRGNAIDQQAAAARMDFIERALAAGHRPSHIARFLGRTPAAVTNLLRRRRVKIGV